MLSSKDLGISNLKIADFGLSRFLDHESLAKTVCGTPGYVAPEVLQKLPYGKECDFWAIGIVTYILLCGAPPFQEENDYDLYDKIINCNYDFDDEIFDDVSVEAKDFVSKILVADPKERLTCESMLSHPWMTKEHLSENKLSKAQTMLSRFATISRDQS